MREPKGQAIGGQFKARVNPESAVVLDVVDGETFWDVEFTRGFENEHAIVKAPDRERAITMVREAFDAFDDVSVSEHAAVQVDAPAETGGPNHDMLWPDGEQNRILRGYDFLTEQSLDRIPELYETEDIPMRDKVIFEHYFVGPCNWYVAEIDKVTGSAFAYCDLGPTSRTWSYVNLVELEEIVEDKTVVQRQTNFRPATALSLGLVED